MSRTVQTFFTKEEIEAAFLEFNQARMESEIAYNSFNKAMENDLPDEKLIVLQKAFDTAQFRFIKAHKIKRQIKNSGVVFDEVS
jgi:hypothetical protein